ncbi:DUF1073 domain-containing protein [Providencia rettgeri]|uniref:phage portal protein n=1 Tax=Providencia rettgeri TaxID=587 RepID=UPI001EE75522|nr:DUF1073 domain-containing protein [Providencia rettgeri]MCG5369568.1 DUF1073 domain-containing protein [Providencia rettgeri]
MTNTTRIGRLKDSLSSMMTSLGEKIGAVVYSEKKEKVSDKELLAMYENSWVVAKYINKTADDMLKIPRAFVGDIDSSLKQQIEDIETELKTYQIKHDALTWSSLLGDALIVAITDCDDVQIVSPLNLQNENIVKFLVLRKGEYTPSSKVICDIQSPHLGEPIIYSIDIGTGELKFHHTRCHRIKLGKHSIKDRCKFGTSDIQAAYDAIKIFDTAIVSTGDTIQEANVDVIFIPDMNNQIAAGQEAKVLDYLRVMKEGKSSTGIVAIDAGDDSGQGRYEQKTAQFAGLSDVITKMFSVLAGALSRPLSILFGQSATGFSSGEEDNKAYYEDINARQESRLRPIQDFIDQFILDKLAITDELKYTYPSIDSLNEAELATRFTAYATGFSSLFQDFILDEKTILREMIARGLLTTVTEKDIEAIIASTGTNEVNNGTPTAFGSQAGEEETSPPANAIYQTE